jgi:radical S-adenosyl methionine domain-containing protein 2
MSYPTTSKSGIGCQREVNELVLNWHVTKNCNYQCQFCYAKWVKSENELVRSFGQSTMLLEKMFDFFRPDNLNNPLQKHMKWRTVRLNFAGGEPLLYLNKLLPLICTARKIGFNISLITNGSFMTSDVANNIAPHLSMLALSLDSMNKKTNQKIGRCDRHGKSISLNSLLQAMHDARQINPAMKIKVNTVVNALNSREDLSCMIYGLQPKKWKVLKMLPIITNDLSINDDEFEGFVSRHAQFQQIICVEDNSDMSDSYIMINPQGCFFQNEYMMPGYKYSPPIMDVGASKAFDATSLSPMKFCDRYK